jgi:hypothetical protein
VDRHVIGFRGDPSDACPVALARLPGGILHALKRRVTAAYVGAAGDPEESLAVPDGEAVEELD